MESFDASITSAMALLLATGGFERRLLLQASKAGNVRIYFFTWLRTKKSC